MSRAKAKREKEPELLAEAYLGDFLKRIDQTIRYLVASCHYKSLLEVDPKVAAVAIKVFRSAEGAAFWLTRDAKELGGRVPLEVARTLEGAAEVVQLMRTPTNRPGYASPEEGLATLLSAEGGCVTVSQAQKLYRRKALTNQIKRSNAVVYQDRDGRFHVPVWQFRPTGGLLKGLPKVLRALREKVPGYCQLTPFTFFLQPDPIMHFRTPLAALRDGDLESVLGAVDDLGH